MNFEGVLGAETSREGCWASQVLLIIGVRLMGHRTRRSIIVELSEDKMWEGTVNDPPNDMVMAVSSFMREITISRWPYIATKGGVASRGGKEGGQ